MTAKLQVMFVEIEGGMEYRAPHGDLMIRVDVNQPWTMTLSKKRRTLDQWIGATSFQAAMGRAACEAMRIEVEQNADQERVLAEDYRLQHSGGAEGRSSDEASGGHSPKHRKAS